jgi:hypothetical protein
MFNFCSSSMQTLQGTNPVIHHMTHHHNIHTILKGRFHPSAICTANHMLISSITVLPSGSTMPYYLLDVQLFLAPWHTPHTQNHGNHASHSTIAFASTHTAQRTQQPTNKGWKRGKHKPTNQPNSFIYIYIKKSYLFCALNLTMICFTMHKKRSTIRFRGFRVKL